MIEQHPLDDFDLDDFFSCVATHGLAGAVALKQPELPAPKENTEFATQHKEFQTKLLRDFFSGKSFTSMNAIAKDLINYIEADKKTNETASTDDLQRRLYRETTMKTLSKVAEDNFNEAVTQSGQAIPNSPEQLKHRKDADDWSLARQIVDTAVALEQ